MVTVLVGGFAFSWLLKSGPAPKTSPRVEAKAAAATFEPTVLKNEPNPSTSRPAEWGGTGAANFRSVQIMTARYRQCGGRADRRFTADPPRLCRWLFHGQDRGDERPVCRVRKGDRICDRCRAGNTHAEDFPRHPVRKNLVAGSVVYSRPIITFSSMISQWWSYVPGANWRHPLGRKAT